MHKKFNYPTRAALSKMTTDDAWAIQMYLAELEFPKVFSTSVFFALFKVQKLGSFRWPKARRGQAQGLTVLAFTDIRLLVSTGQLSNPVTSSKRYADTGALLLETVLNPPTSDRSISAIARINYLHDRHRKSGKIKEPDMLYTLSLFALEPSRWVARYEWRQLTDMELCAIGTFWKSLGDAMMISYGKLPSSRTKWKDGLHWLEEMDAWSQEYERSYMVPNINNKLLGQSTAKILLFGLPSWLHGVAIKAFTCLLDDRLRASMMFPDPPTSYNTVVNGALHLRKLVIRHLCLPRNSRVPYFADSATPGRYHMLLYRGHPWYVKPTIWERWGLFGWNLWLQGGAIPGDDGDKYVPQGYETSNMGPSFQHGKGVDYMNETRQRLSQQERGGCPFAFA
ncbi:hypothetical protein MMC30_002554 [Trapelia coarctata]|nr:hypothetical protein [Trapelia coarctata]